MTKGAGLRPEAKATEPPPDPTVGAPVLDSTVIRIEFVFPGPCSGQPALAEFSRYRSVFVGYRIAMLVGHLPSRDHVAELLLRRDSPLARNRGGRSLPLPLRGAAGRLGRLIADELPVDAPVAAARTGRVDYQHGESQLRRVVVSIACPFVRTVNTIGVKAAGRHGHVRSSFYLAGPGGRPSIGLAGPPALAPNAEFRGVADLEGVESGLALARHFRRPGAARTVFPPGCWRLPDSPRKVVAASVRQTPGNDAALDTRYDGGDFAPLLLHPDGPVADCMLG